MSSVHALAARGPTSGRPSTQAGRFGRWVLLTARTQLAISSAFSTIVAIAIDSGTTNASSNVPIIAITAIQRRPQRCACTSSMSGQVATTIIEAQIVAAMNGRRIQKQAAIRPTMKRTANVVRARSARTAPAFSVSATRNGQLLQRALFAARTAPATYPAPAVRCRRGSMLFSRAPDPEDDPDAVAERDQIAAEAEHRVQGHVEDRRSALHGHDDGRSDDDRSREYAHGGAVERAVQTCAEVVETLEIEIDTRFAASRVAQQPREIARHAPENLEEVADGIAAACDERFRLIALQARTAQERHQVIDDLEVGIVLAAESLHRDDGLEHEREVGRDRDRMFPHERREMPQ